MFGVDFSELMVILVIALIVIGPERLPKVARTMGLLWARAQRYVNGVKSDIARDMAVEEFRQLQQSLTQEARNVESSVKQVTQTIDQHVQQINQAALAENKSDSLPKPGPQPTEPPKKFPID